MPDGLEQEAFLHLEHPIHNLHNKRALKHRLTWKTQYYLTVRTDPTGLSPAPTPSSKWYDESTNVDLTAPDPSYLNTDRYNFNHWDVDGTPVQVTRSLCIWTCLTLLQHTMKVLHLYNHNALGVK